MLFFCSCSLIMYPIIGVTNVSTVDMPCSSHWFSSHIRKYQPSTLNMHRKISIVMKYLNLRSTGRHK